MAYTNSSKKQKKLFFEYSIFSNRTYSQSNALNWSTTMLIHPMLYIFSPYFVCFSIVVPPFFPPSVHFPSSFPPQISLQHHCALFSPPFPWGRLENSIIVRRLHGSRCYQCNREFTNIKKRLVHIHLFWIYYVLRRKELHIYHSVNKYFLATKNKTTTAWQIGILLT